jgi:hypothetical protein
MAKQDLLKDEKLEKTQAKLDKDDEKYLTRTQQQSEHVNLVREKIAK